MSKSLKRVAAALDALNVETEIKEVGQALTAAAAADALGCKIDQIANSIILLGLESGRTKLFLTSGANRVDIEKAARAVGEPLGKANAAIIRAQTGFAIGGVAPVGHLQEIDAWMDPHLFNFPQIYAAAGTPRHLFGTVPQVMQRISGSQLTDFVEISK